MVGPIYRFLEWPLIPGPNAEANPFPSTHSHRMARTSRCRDGGAGSCCQMGGDLTISSRDFNNQEYGFKPGVIKINPD